MALSAGVSQQMRAGGAEMTGWPAAVRLFLLLSHVVTQESAQLCPPLSQALH
jgi:hypothetical protein